MPTLLAKIAVQDSENPFLIPDTLGIICEVFKHVYPKKHTAGYTKKIGSREIVFCCRKALAGIRSWRTSFRTNAVFEDEEAIASHVHEHVNPPDTMTFHWRQYDAKGRSGSYEDALLLQVFATHLTVTASADTSWFDDSKPLQALVLSLIALERALSLWATGSEDKGEGAKARLNEEKWGDQAGSSARGIIAITERNPKKWQNIVAGARMYCAAGRGRSLPTAASQGGKQPFDARQMVEESDVEVSDDEISAGDSVQRTQNSLEI